MFTFIEDDVDDLLWHKVVSVNIRAVAIVDLVDNFEDLVQLHEHGHFVHTCELKDTLAIS